ncbi:hypothetical protein [Edaphobacter modestus]|uniref:Uncharacterized protein n=1 Tax=Edaphobacter modestus TaxID=388466 RepID=A0A4Q7Z297_9BACT|nr:hypothetical protein [Edaphobacter modestus]RZU43675.1 hypothetical protein BDD14_5369 [Edaphobacter modestus]
MNHALVARILLSILCALQGLATLAIDLNRTHATNPTWTGHARFHVVWQTITVTLPAGVEFILIWSHGLPRADGFYIACLLTSLSPLAFLFALTTRRIYGGTLSDPNGIPPVQLACCGRALSIDMNLTAIIIALACIAVIIVIYRA